MMYIYSNIDTLQILRCQHLIFIIDERHPFSIVIFVDIVLCISILNNNIKVLNYFYFK